MAAGRFVPTTGSAATLTIVCASVATFARAVPYPLQTSWDDGRFLIDDPYVRSVSFANLIAIFSGAHFEAYHPLHLLSYWLDVPWLGPQPAALHLVSLALWCVSLCLVNATLRALGLGVIAACLSTLLVGLHPVQVEAVSWAAGRKEVLALLFTFASLLLHLRSRSGVDRAALASHAFFVLAALSKTTTLPLPLWLAAIDVLVRGRRPLDALRTQLPKLVLALALGVMVVNIWQANEMVRVGAGGVLGAPARLCVTWTHQLATALWPGSVSPMYTTRSIAAAGWTAAAGPAALLVVGIWLARARCRLELAGLIGFALLLLPASNLVPMYFPLQDRYLSLPLFGLALVLAALLDRIPARLGLAVATLAVVALAGRTVQYEGEWSSELRLWGHAAHTQPDAEYAWMKLGEVRRDAGDLEGGIAAARAHVALTPERRLAWAALFELVALRDERNRHLTPSRARTLAQQYYARLDDVAALRALAGELLSAGYVRAMELPLSRSLLLQLPPDALLEVAALNQLRAGRGSLAQLYVTAMRSPSQLPELAEVRRRHYFRVLPSPSDRPTLD